MSEELRKISRIIAVAQLQSVRLVASSAHSTIRSSKDVEQVELLIDTSSQPPKPAEAGVFYVQATIHARVVSRKPEEKTAVSVQATFELAYLLPADMQASEEELNDFARINAIFNAWPYWREFIQSTVTRMNLPPVVLPLFRLQDAIKQVAATPQKQALPAPEAVPAKS